MKDGKGHANSKCLFCYWMEKKMGAESQYIDAIGKGFVMALVVAVLGLIWFLARKLWRTAKDSPEMRDRIAYVVSFIWLFLVGMGSNEYRGFNISAFLFIGVLPIAGYWGYRRLFPKKT